MHLNIYVLTPKNLKNLNDYNNLESKNKILLISKCKQNKILWKLITVK